LIFVLSASAFAISQTSFKNDLSQLNKLLSADHVQPRAVDESLCHDVIQNLLGMIDPDKLYYTQADVIKITAIQNKILKQILIAEWEYAASGGKVSKSYTNWKPRPERGRVVLEK